MVGFVPISATAATSIIGIMIIWTFILLLPALFAIVVTEEDTDMKSRAEKVKTELCSAQVPTDRTERFFECDPLITLIVSTLK